MHYYTMVKFLHWQQYTNATVSYIETDRHTRADPGLVNGGGEVEAPQVPRWVGFGEGVSGPQKFF